MADRQPSASSQMGLAASRQIALSAQQINNTGYKRSMQEIFLFFMNDSGIFKKTARAAL
ncbi:MAG: hypothetical protein AAGU74_08895 [Bacillota bacterium]